MEAAISEVNSVAQHIVLHIRSRPQIPETSTCQRYRCATTETPGSQSECVWRICGGKMSDNLQGINVDSEVVELA